MAKEIKSSVSYFLREPKGKTETPINIFQRFNNETVKVSTGLKVLPSHWDISRQRVRNVVAATEKDLVNDFLANVETRAKRLFVELQTSQTLSKATLKAGLEEIVRPKPPEPVSTESALMVFIQKFIDDSPTRPHPKTSKTTTSRTIQKYKTVFRIFKEFGDTYSRRLDFETMDLRFADDFTRHLIQTKGFSTNNLGKYIQTLKVFLNAAMAQGLDKTGVYQSKNFHVPSEPADDVYLTVNDIELITSLDLTGNARLERVKDLFLIGCWTGFRYSDLSELRPEMMGKDGRIRLEQVKTGGKVVMPSHPVIKEILQRYNGKWPPAISNQKMNDYLKEVCQLAGITETVTKSITKGGQRITRTFEKWELVSTHTARRSFATNLYKMGVPTITMMSLTGHQSEASFLKYIKLSKEEHADKMQIVLEDQDRNFFAIAN